MDTGALNAVLNSCVSSGEWTLALLALGPAQRIADLPPSTRDLFAEVLAKAGKEHLLPKHETGEAKFGSLPPSPPPPHAASPWFVDTVKHLTQRGKWRQALSIALEHVDKVTPATKNNKRCRTTHWFIDNVAAAALHARDDVAATAAMRWATEDALFPLMRNTQVALVSTLVGRCPHHEHPAKVQQAFSAYAVASRWRKSLALLSACHTDISNVAAVALLQHMRAYNLWEQALPLAYVPSADSPRGFLIRWLSRHFLDSRIRRRLMQPEMLGPSTLASIMLKWFKEGELLHWTEALRLIVSAPKHATSMPKRGDVVETRTSPHVLSPFLSSKAVPWVVSLQLYKHPQLVTQQTRSEDGVLAAVMSALRRECLGDNSSPYVLNAADHIISQCYMPIRRARSNVHLHNSAMGLMAVMPSMWRNAVGVYTNTFARVPPRHRTLSILIRMFTEHNLWAECLEVLGDALRQPNPSSLLWREQFRAALTVCRSAPETHHDSAVVSVVHMASQLGITPKDLEEG